MKGFKLFILNLKYTDKRLLLYFIIISLIYSIYGVTFTLNNFSVNNVTVGDVFLFLFGGVKCNTESIVSYTNWFGFILLIYYPIVYFLSKQFEDKKTFIFYRTEKYKRWYYSNLAISILKILVFLILVYAITFIISSHFISYSSITRANEFNNLKYNLDSKILIFRLLILNIMFIFSMALISMTLLFTTKKIKFSVLITIIITYLSSFINNGVIGRYLLGNVAMVSRNESFELGNNNISFNYAVVFFLVLIIINLISCHLLYRRNIEV